MSTREEETKNLQELAGYCDGVSDNLSKLREQLIKIIEVKKKSSGSAGDSLMFHQVQGVLDAIANLEKINKELPGAIGEVKSLCQQVQQLLAQQLGVKSAPSMGFGGKMTVEDLEHKEGG